MRLGALCCAASAAFVCVPASAQIIEDWESGNSSAWTIIASGTTVTIPVNAAAAKNGSFGAGFTQESETPWFVRSGSSSAPGNTYYTSIRRRANGLGRVYLGVGATGAGTFSAVFAPNTGNLILQENNGFTFLDRGTVGVTLANDTWYVMALEWGASGDMNVKLYDSAFSTLIAETGVVATGYTTPGQVALRGFTQAAGSFLDVDDIGVIPAPASAALLALGVLSAGRRRR